MTNVGYCYLPKKNLISNEGLIMNQQNVAVVLEVRKIWRCQQENFFSCYAMLSYEPTNCISYPYCDSWWAQYKD